VRTKNKKKKYEEAAKQMKAENAVDLTQYLTDYKQIEDEEEGELKKEIRLKNAAKRKNEFLASQSAKKVNPADQSYFVQ